MEKKGQTEGKSVMVIILVIIAIIILYIILAQPEHRDELLDLNEIYSENDTTTTSSSELLSVNPGKISTKSKNILSHEIPDISLYIKKEPYIISLSSQLSISDSWFSSKSPKLKFKIESQNDLDEASLYFSVSETEGNLEIYLNENLVHKGELDPGYQIIDLPEEYLQEKNILEFETSTPFFPWSTNTYVLRDVGVKEEFEIINSKEERIFNLNEEEFTNLKNVQLDYYQICNQKPKLSTTPLKIFLNEEQIFTTSITCTNMKQTVDLPLSNLKEESNKLMFVLEDGDFLFNNLKVITELKKSSHNFYDFIVSEEKYAEIEDEDTKVKLKLIFESDDKEKEATIKINEGEFSLSTENDIALFDISSLILEGTNFIKISPDNSFTIENLKVYYQ